MIDAAIKGAGIKREQGEGETDKKRGDLKQIRQG